MRVLHHSWECGHLVIRSHRCWCLSAHIHVVTMVVCRLGRDSPSVSDTCQSRQRKGGGCHLMPPDAMCHCPPGDVQYAMVSSPMTHGAHDNVCLWTSRVVSSGTCSGIRIQLLIYLLEAWMPSTQTLAVQNSCGN